MHRNPCLIPIVLRLADQDQTQYYAVSNLCLHCLMLLFRCIRYGEERGGCYDDRRASKSEGSIKERRTVGGSVGNGRQSHTLGE